MLVTITKKRGLDDILDRITLKKIKPDSYLLFNEIALHPIAEQFLYKLIYVGKSVPTENSLVAHKNVKKIKHIFKKNKSFFSILLEYLHIK